MKISIRNKLRWFIAVIILLIFLHYTSISEPIEYQIYNAFFPTQDWLFKKSNKFGLFFYYLINANKLMAENNLLKDKINELIKKQTELEITRQENQNLKNSLNYLSTVNYNYLTAKIIGRNIQNPQLLILDKGGMNGVKDNLIVIYNNGVVLGKISQTANYLSYLLLLTDNQSLIAAKIINQNNTTSLIRGELGISANMTMVPQEENININDIVITSGLEENIPSGLLIGQILEIKNSPEALFKNAIIKPFFDIRQTEYVTIILPKNE